VSAQGIWPPQGQQARSLNSFAKTACLPVSAYFEWIFMPTYHVEMIEGRTIEQKRKLVQEITRVSVEVLGGSPDSVDVLIVDVKPENWATGGKLWTNPRS
jgi:4-oxalocrotonate tautomerase